MTWTKEREDWIRECVSRNPEMETVEGHDWRGRAADLLSWLDAEREARQRAERERDEARADEQKARDLLLASEHARQSLRAERDAIAARYDALREAAARVQAKFYEPSEEPDDTLDPMREPLGLLFRALADPDGAARERAERQAEREQAIAVAVRDAVVLTDAEVDEIVASVRGRT